MHRYRRLVTTTVGFTFLVVGITGVIFKLFFKNHTLEEIHGWLGLAMVVAAVVHAVQNGRSLLKHLRDRRVWALLVPIGVLCAFFALHKEPPRAGLNPRKIVHQLTEARAADVAVTFGRPLPTIQASMKRDGLEPGADRDTIQQLADRNQQPPERILGYFTM